MKLVRAVYRALGFVFLLVFTALLIIAAGWWPIRIRNIGLGTWFVHFAARGLAGLCDVRIRAMDGGQVKNYAGFIFSNHTSYMDIVVIMAHTPVRFVAKSAIRYWPFIGFFATTIGCVYVDRKDKQSRKATRKVLEDIDPYPPIVLYPEGKTAPIGRLLPFRRGAFEIAQDGQVPYRLCPIIYSDPSLVDWKSRSGWLAAWEMFSRQRPLRCDIRVLAEHLPTPEEAPDELAKRARAQMLAVLVNEGNYINE